MINMNFFGHAALAEESLNFGHILFYHYILKRVNDVSAVFELFGVRIA